MNNTNANFPLQFQAPPPMNKVQNDHLLQNQLDPQANAVDPNQDDCYQNSMQTCGTYCGFLRTWMPFCFFCVSYPYQEVPQSYEGLLQRFGKYVKTLKPGLQYMNPCTEDIVKIDMKTIIIDLAKQMILTKDNISITIDASVYFRIVDSKRATYRVKNIREAVQFLTFSSLRNTCGQHVLQDLLEKRLEVTSTIRRNVEEHVDEWGVKIDNIFIKDILLSSELQYALSSAAKERRIAESKIISAKADVEAAKLMKEAADILDNKAAMQIRYLETLAHISKSHNSRLIFLPQGGQGELDHKITQGLLS